MRVQVQGEQLHQAILCFLTQLYTFICVLWTALIFVTVTKDYDHVLCASVKLKIISKTLMLHIVTL